jgi:hypothetical protein
MRGERGGGEGEKCIWESFLGFGFGFFFVGFETKYKNRNLWIILVSIRIK